MPKTPRRGTKRAAGVPPNVDQETADRRALCGSRRHIVLFAAIVVAVGLGAGVEAWRLLRDPRVYFLWNRGDAEWIRAETPFSLKARRPADIVTVFERRFTTSQAVRDARLTIRAFRRGLVELDEKRIDLGPPDLKLWNQPREVTIAGPLPAGSHRLSIAVFNHSAYPCLLVESDQLDVSTGPGWDVVRAKGQRSPAVPAAHIELPEQASLYPHVDAAFFALAPWLALIFGIAFGWSIWRSRPVGLAEKRPHWWGTPRAVRWVLLAAWLVLAANNIWQLPSPTGYDLNGHLDYVAFLVRRQALPLATDGWQMFQSPLFYLLNAPFYAWLAPHLEATVIVKILRFIPLLCGLAQIEIVYRAARTVFPDKEDLQIIATVVGGLMPMQIYISQVIGNEPLAGCLTAVLVLLCLSLLVEPVQKKRTWFFLAMGIAWGLAILTKVTPVLLGPLLIGVVAVHGRAIGDNWRRCVSQIGLVFGACLLTAGWYFLWNWLTLGSPFMSGWAAGRGRQVWWQDPSYRMIGHVTSFGLALSRPLYGPVASLWDALYSTLWLDGFISGLVTGCPWNVDWMLAGAWLALVPMGLLFGSLVTCWRSEVRPARNALLFSVAALATYVAAIADLFVRLPVYSTAKATYTVGLLPCYGILAAAGAAPLLKYRYLRAAVFSAVACWAIAAYLAYFCVGYYRDGQISP